LLQNLAAAAGRGGAGGRGGGGRGGRGGGAETNAQDLVARAGSVKSAIMSIWESPSDILVRRYNDVKAALPAAIAEANAFAARVSAMSTTLNRHGITLNTGR
jgi:hypothetical protein